MLISRLVLNEKKLKTLHTGLKQIAKTCDSIVGRVTRRTQVAEGLELCQVTAPIGVLMVIFESRPDALPQVGCLLLSTRTCYLKLVRAFYYLLNEDHILTARCVPWLLCC